MKKEQPTVKDMRKVAEDCGFTHISEVIENIIKDGTNERYFEGKKRTGNHSPGQRLTLANRR